jgi:excisionase family DNA binding protein
MTADTPPSHPNVYSPATLAKRWECSERTIRNLIASGELPHFRVRKLFRIRAVDVEEYEARMMQAPDPEPVPEPVPPIKKPRRKRLDTGW